MCIPVVITTQNTRASVQYASYFMMTNLRQILIILHFAGILFKSVQEALFPEILPLPNVIMPAKPNELSDKGK